MKIGVIGANGQLGTDLCLAFQNKDCVALNHSDIEISDEKNCIEVISAHKFDALFNTAAFHNVPKCETHIDEALKVNVKGPQNLAKACEMNNTQLIHFSTDYVFDGLKKKPYLESDLPNPLNVYGITKCSGEYMVSSYCSNYKIVRISGIYGKVPCRAKGDKNFVYTMLKLAQEKDNLQVVDDEITTPTSTKDIARQMKSLIEIDQSGVFHVSNQSECSWYEFALEIFKLKNIHINVEPVKAVNFTQEFKRPAYSVLENDELKKNRCDQMLHWKDALAELLREI